MANDEVGYKAVDIDMENKFVLFLGFVLCTILGLNLFCICIISWRIIGSLGYKQGDKVS